MAGIYEGGFLALREKNPENGSARIDTILRASTVLALSDISGTGAIWFLQKATSTTRHLQPKPIALPKHFHAQKISPLAAGIEIKRVF